MLQGVMEFTVGVLGCGSQTHLCRNRIKMHTIDKQRQNQAQAKIVRTGGETKISKLRNTENNVTCSPMLGNNFNSQATGIGLS